MLDLELGRANCWIDYRFAADGGLREDQAELLPFDPSDSARRSGDGRPTIVFAWSTVKRPAAADN